MEEELSITDDSKPFDMETNFIVCKCKTKNLYTRHLGDGGYDWCKICNKPLGQTNKT